MTKSGNATVRWLHTMCLTFSSLLLITCGEDVDTIGDSVPPSAVNDLVVGRAIGTSLTAAWTATGDDGDSGQATYYDLRYSKEPINEQSWSGAAQWVEARRPFSAGVFQGFQVFGLDASTQYFFAVKSADEDHNWSELSNVASAVTSGYSDSIPPAAIVDLTIDSTTSFTISLSWAATGDDGMDGRASSYDVRFSVLPIITEADWAASARLIGEPSPAPPGQRQSMTVTGLIPNRRFYFAARAGDEIVNWSSLEQFAAATTNAAEIVPPAAITDLTVGNIGLTSVQLWWTAPGDDGDIGRASEYDIRTYSFLMTEENWGNCSRILGEPAPTDPGLPQSLTISGLDPFRVYNLAMKTGDEIPNWSPMSNMITFTTNGGGASTKDTIPPGRITDFTVTASQQTALALRWRSAGDDGYFGNPSVSDLRYSRDSLTDANWESATRVDYVLPPRTAGTIMTMDVINLTPGTVYYFGLKTGDEVPNWSPLSIIARGETRP